PPTYQRLHLPRRLVLDRLLEEAEGVQVLDLPPRAELVRARRPHGDVGVAAERALLHVAVADADPAHQRVERLRVRHRFLRAPHVGLGNDLQERRAGAIQVDAAEIVEAFVNGLSRVLLQVGAGQPYLLLLAVHEYRHRAAFDDGHLVLADLVGLGKIRVEIILAGEYRAAADVLRAPAVHREA